MKEKIIKLLESYNSPEKKEDVNYWTFDYEDFGFIAEEIIESIDIWKEEFSEKLIKDYMKRVGDFIEELKNEPIEF